jgi:anti-sigma regulatory factor (Ser/Thr protein kinase)
MHGHTRAKVFLMDHGTRVSPCTPARRHATCRHRVPLPARTATATVTVISRTPEKDPDEMPATGPLPTFPERAWTSRPPDSRWPTSSAMPPLGALPTAAAAARAHVRTVLKSWGVGGELTDDVEMAVSELVANSVNASTGPDGRPLYVDGRMLVVWLRLSVDGAMLRAEVWDEALGVPARRAASAGDVSGRGLELVEARSAGWGWFPAQSGKCTWAEFRP